MAYEGPEYWTVIYKAIGDFGGLMRDAAQAKAALEGMQDAVKAESAAEVSGASQAAAARQKDIQSIGQQTQALQQLANAAKNTNVQLEYGGRTSIEQHLSDMAQELNYTTLLNRQKWLGFSSVQQAMSYRQQLYNLALLENRAHFAGYQTADQYLSFMQRETATTAALSAVIRDRTAVIAGETTALLAHTNALQGTHQTAGALGEQISSAGALTAAINSIPDVQVTRLQVDDAAAMAELAAYRAALLSLPRTERTDIISSATRLGGVPLTPQRQAMPATARPDIDYGAVNRMLAQSTSQVHPEPVRAPLAIGAGSGGGGGQDQLGDDQVGLMWERQTESAKSLADSMRELTSASAVSAEAIGKFQDSMHLAQVDARALEQGIGRLAAAQQLLQVNASSAAPVSGRRGQRKPMTPEERNRNLASYYGLNEVAGAVRSGQISDAPHGYPLPAPGMGIVAGGQQGQQEPQGSGDVWDMLDQFQHAPRGIEGAKSGAGENLDDVSRGMDQLNAKAGQWNRALDDAENSWDAIGAAEREAVSDQDAAARRAAALAHAQAVTQAVSSGEAPEGVEVIFDHAQADREVHAFEEELAGLPDHEVVEGEFVDGDARHDLADFVEELAAAARRRYEFTAGLNDEQALAALSELSAKVKSDEVEEEQLSRLVAGSGGASGGGGGGSPPKPPGDPDDWDAWEEYWRKLSQYEADATKGVQLYSQAAGGIPHPEADESRAWAQIDDALGNVGRDAKETIPSLAEIRAGLGGLNDPAAKAADALTSTTTSATNLGWAMNLLRKEVPLWSGLFGDRAMLGQVQLWHIALDSIVEVLALWVPALLTAGAGLAGFAAAGMKAAQEVAREYVNLRTTGAALNETIPPLTDNFQKLENAVRPQVYELLGDYLTIAGGKAGVFNNLIQQTGTYLDRFAAKIVVALQGGGNGLANFFAAGAKDLALLGKGFDDLGPIIVKFLQATAITHVAEDLAAAGDAILGVVAAIVKIIPTPVLAFVLGLHAIVLWGGLAADAVGKVVIGVAGLASRFEVMNSASLALARALSATDEQLVAISSRSAGVKAVTEALGGQATAEEVAQLGLNVENTGKSIEQFVADAGTVSAQRLNRFSSGLDDAGKSAVALGIASGASDVQLGSLAGKLSGVATEAEGVGVAGEEAAAGVAGGGGLLGALSKLSPVLGNVYVDLGLVAVALAAIYAYLGTRADATKKFTDQLGDVVTKASLLTVVSANVSSLAQATDALNTAQATGVGNTAELAASQADLSGKLGEELAHVGDVSKAYGTDFVGALGLLKAAGVSTSQLFSSQNSVWATAMQMVKGLVAGYEAMGQRLGMIGGDLDALAVSESSQLKSMQALNQAWDAFTSLVSGAPNAFIAYAQGVATFQKDAAAAGATMSGLGASSLTLQSDFQSNYNNVEKFFDAFRDDQALTGTGNFTQFVKDAVANLIPMAGGSKEAAAQISALAQEAGGPATTSISTLQRWVGNIKDPLQAMYAASNQAAIGASNLSQDAARLTNTLQNLLDPAMSKAIFDAHGGQAVFESFSQALAKTGPNSKVTVDAAHAVATELLAVTGNSKEAKSQFIGYAEASGLSAKQAEKLWDQASKNITGNLAQIRSQIAKTSAVPDSIKPPGETDTMMKSFKDGTFYELTFLSWIPQVQRGLNIMNHDIGQFFGKDVPKAAQATGHAFEAAWDGMVNWFSDSVPHGLETAWDSVSSFFDKVFTHDIPEGWDKAWADVVAPVERAFNAVTSWVSSNFDKWWATHGESVEIIWNHVWDAIKATAVAVWDAIIATGEGFWHSLTAIFTSGPAKAIWGFLVTEAKAAWALVVSTASASWTEIEGLAKAAWDIVAAVAKAAWDIISDLIVAVVKSAVIVLEAAFKIAWDVVVAAAKIAWDAIVLIIDLVLDLLTGHWHQAWVDMQSFGIQVWNAIKTAGIQVWNAISSAATQVWAKIWGAIKTAGVQAWNALSTGAKQAWNAIWSALNSTVIAPMSRFFTSTVPGWWTTLSSKWKTMWSTAWTDINNDVLQPIEKWFTTTLPAAMWNSIKGGIDKVIGGINTVIGFINSVTSVVGVHIGTVPTLAHGGPVQRIGSGSVPGTGDEDGTHVVAMGGEYMLRKPARMALQAEYGQGIMDHLNNADTWLGSGSRGNTASQRAGGGRRYASGGVLGDIGNWLGDAASAVSGAAKDVWGGITAAAGDVAKFGEKAVFDAMWTASGAPAEKGLEALGTPGDMGASWLQDVHNGVEGWIDKQTAAAQAKQAATAKSSGSITGAGVSNTSAEAALQSAAAKKGWTGAQWTALFDVEEREAGFSLTATNPSSGAYGMAQFIDGPSEYAQYGGNSSTAAGQAVAMVNYIAQRYGTPAAAWAHEQAYNWYAAGGPVMSAIRAAASNLNQQKSMALGAQLLTKMNTAGTDTTRSEYGAWLINTAKNKGLTQAQAQDPTQAARFVAPYYAKSIMGTPASGWNTNAAGASELAYVAASTAMGTHSSTPSAATLDDAWGAVMDNYTAVPGTTTAGTSTNDVSAYQADAARLYPLWEAALGPWHTLSALKQPKGVTAGNWASWLKQRAVVQDRVNTASGYIAPLFTDLKTSPDQLTPALWSNSDSSVRRWQQAMDVASWAKGSEAQYYSPIESNLTSLQTAIIDAANDWHQVYGTTHTPTPGGGGSTGGGTSTPGTGGGGPSSVGTTSIDLNKLIVGGPTLGNTGGYGFSLAGGGAVPSLGSVAGMFSGGMAAGGVIPTLNVPGLSQSMAKQLGAATSGAMPRTLSDAAGSRTGLHVDQLTINNPVSEQPSESITRASNRLAFLGGRGMI